MAMSKKMMKPKKAAPVQKKPSEKPKGADPNDYAAFMITLIGDKAKFVDAYAKRLNLSRRGFVKLAVSELCNVMGSGLALDEMGALKRRAEGVK